MGDFEKWFEDQDFYTNMRFIHGDRRFDKDGDVYRVLPVQIAYQGWNARQSEIDELRAQLECCRKENAVLLGKVGELQGQLKTWKGQSMSAMIHGTCSCGEPWQRVISDREGFSLLHCFNCNNNRYENKEYFGDHEPKTLRGAND